ncbi:MAG: ferredoxin [Actinomycetota bacterium]|nr:ferredoxin [Actinomycetota bacterium]MEC7152770.1 ferredoxin [Actinomycetota bacterium]MEC7366988.1 ferredoxin [Actinomycetota bacterium]MEC8119416.1 ferredoxin [Actinomycetota bacterium]MEC8364946.1 ferredoxin [Actinomycetota bacterium]
MTFRIEIETEDCMSSGKCVADYPEVFAFDEDELAEILPNAELTDKEIIKVARNCPSRAILVFDENNEQVDT